MGFSLSLFGSMHPRLLRTILGLPSPLESVLAVGPPNAFDAVPALAAGSFFFVEFSWC